MGLSTCLGDRPARSPGAGGGDPPTGPATWKAMAGRSTPAAASSSAPTPPPAWTEVAASALAADDPPYEDAPSHADWLSEEEEEGGAGAGATTPAGPAPAPPSASPPSSPPTAADLAAHAAAFAGDVAGTLAALRSLPPHLRAATDPAHGNTVLQIAALRGHGGLVGALLASGLVRAGGRGARRWTALDEAALRGDQAIITALATAQAAEAKAARAAARAALAAALTGAPDFAASLRWEFGSPVLGPLLRAVAPHDTYRVWKVGSALRIDGTLRGLDVPGGGGSGGSGPALPSWRRGPFSLVWHAPSTPPPPPSSAGASEELPATAWLIDRAKNSYVDLAAERRAVLRESGTGGGAADAAAVAAKVAARAAGGRARLVPGPLTFTPARAWMGLGGTAQPVRLPGGFTAAPFEVTLPLTSAEASRGRLDVDGGWGGATWARYLATPPAPDTLTVQAVDPLAMAGMPGRGGGGGGGGGGGSSSSSSSRPCQPLTAKVWLAGADFPLPGTALAAVLEVAAAASPHLAPLGRFARKAAVAAADAAAAAEADRRKKGGASGGGGGEGGRDAGGEGGRDAGGAGVAVRLHLPLALTVHASLSIQAASRLGPCDEAVREAATWFGLPRGCRVKAAADLALGKVVTHAATSAAAARAAGGAGGAGGRGSTASDEGGGGGGGSPHLARLIARRPRTESVYSSTVGDEYDELEF